MVAIVQTVSRDEAGQIKRDAWFSLLSVRYPKEKLKEVSDWFAMASPRGLEIASILLDLQADLDAILAALLIDFDPAVSQAHPLPAHIEKLLKSVADLNQVGKILFVQKRAHKIEGVRAMMLAMIQDVRVVLIKLAERTLALRQSKLLSLEDRKNLAYEVKELYAPLANRLGVGALKWELEDRAFSILEAEAYRNITEALKGRRIEREAFIQQFLEQLSQLLESAHLSAEVSGRVKHIYSIWLKMQKKNLQFSDLYDVRAVRILVPDIADCYAVMALLHAQWTPLSSEYTDYIVHPKSNGYRSLHTVLEGEDGLPIEVQIRTYAMHTQCETGLAAHWRYKEGSQLEAAAQRVEWLRTLLDWQAEVSQGESVPPGLDEQVYIFTKDKEVLALKKGATPIDFAFLVHTSIGLRTKGALVNGRMMPLTYCLQTGDQVEILLHKEAHPSRDWLASRQFLITTHARRKLRAYFHALDAHLSQKVVTAEVLPALPSPKKVKLLSGKKRGISVSGIKQLPFQLALCCSPVEGEPIMASMTQARGFVIHAQRCHYIEHFKKTRSDRLYEVDWD